ncbi:tRNA uridine 5-oxyacetic acid(34) methyltransferase CmoM [Zophobihabitans entericus]|uniref:tRNA 5-carboxymethoxyuridine methyltransferase n=1 Tax=Zophobihabitans entericus TaxID=1635327 RepID=A0A6G9IBA6_9GAMM|nr:tRNA uridine 5-oxyacetic acid(34) methyltransferase CmoM [Zophobihabitans entericus]QIQ21117.1 tRNA uridine 5-oxyacetic acid(34) methyltransferase CmoM [Zophobihabitans entericus]
MSTSAKDRNFDDIAGKFSQNIYGTTKGRIRETIIWQDLEHILSTYPKGKSLTILDAGGGQGQIACRLAALGHDVTLCDISANMLDIAKQNAVQSGVQLHYIHSSIQDIAQHLPEKVDLVIFHAVLEWVSDPQLVLSTLYQCLHDSGTLSLMFYNYHGLFFKTVTLGNFGYADAGMTKRKKKTLSPDYPRKLEDVQQWLAELPMTIVGKTGIRVFHDYMTNKTKQQEAFEELLKLEQQYCRQEPYLSLARYIHVIAKK